MQRQHRIRESDVAHRRLCHETDQLHLDEREQLSADSTGLLRTVRHMDRQLTLVSLAQRRYFSSLSTQIFARVLEAADDGEIVMFYLS